MSGLTLFSLDVLVNVPRLFANALVAATGKEEQEVYDAIAETSCDPLRALKALVGEEQVGNAYTRFLPLVSSGAHRLVKPKGHELIDACRAQDMTTGILYPLPQKAVEEIVRSAKLRAPLTIGYANLDELREKVDRHAGQDEVTYVLGRLVDLPQEFVDTAYPPRVLRESQHGIRSLSDNIES